MPAEVVRRKTGARQIRDRQRTVHLLTGLLVVVYVYFPLDPGSLVEAGIRWVVMPVLVAAGVVMWQWPTLRRMARQRRAGP